MLAAPNVDPISSRIARFGGAAPWPTAGPLRGDARREATGPARDDELPTGCSGVEGDVRGLPAVVPFAAFRSDSSSLGSAPGPMGPPERKKPH